MRGRGDRGRHFPTAQIKVGPYFLTSHNGSFWGQVWVKGRRCLLVRGNAALNFYTSMMLDPEQWEMVLQVYAGHPVPALTLAYQLIEIKRSVKRGQKGIPDAIAGLDLAVEAL